MKKPTKKRIKKSGERTRVDNHRTEKNAKTLSDIELKQIAKLKIPSEYPHYNLINKYGIATFHELPKRINKEMGEFGAMCRERKKEERRMKKYLMDWSKEMCKKINDMIPLLEEGRSKGLYILGD
jgi:hypothetical protein